MTVDGLSCRSARVYMVLLALAPVLADQAPPDYGRVLAREASARLEELNLQGRYADAVAWGGTFQDQVIEAAEIEYEIAYAWNALGEQGRAERHYRGAIERDPAYAAAWYDLGELLLIAGELSEAEEAFAQAAALRPDHWAGPFRLAEVAARRGDAARFEEQLRLALASGFSFRVVVGDANWLGYYRDPALRDVIRRLVTVYSDERLLDAFQEESPTP
jgi:tetratricopeptide (TPR) repeat protein